jgi:predicted Zn-dependent protease
MERSYIHDDPSAHGPVKRSRQGAWRATMLPVLLLAVGCATVGINRGDVNLVGLNDEWQLGRQLETQLAGKLRLVNDPATVSYVNEIGQRIVRQTEMARMPWEFHVVADKEINAFNIPGGHVYVNTGLIRAASTPAELAGVLAHEIGHGVSRHSTERISKVHGLNLGAGLLLGQNPSTLQRIAAQIAAGGVVAKFSRSDEREADRLGVQYMYGAGYDPRGMANMFEKLLRERKRRPGAVEQFFATHPLAEDRIASVRQHASSLPRKRFIGNDGRLGTIQQRVARYQG